MRANWDHADQASAHAAQERMIYQHGLAILEAARERAFETGATNNMNISRKLVVSNPKQLVSSFPFAFSTPHKCINI